MKVWGFRARWSVRSGEFNSDEKSNDSFYCCLICELQTEIQKRHGSIRIINRDFFRRNFFYFAFPGRDTPEDSKFKVRRKVVSFIDKAKFRIDGFIYSLDDLDSLIALKKRNREE